MKRELLKDEVGACHSRVNNHSDKEYKPQPGNKIISSAKKEVGEEMEYSLLSGNCEHFVTSLRYGESRNLQVRPFLGYTVSLSWRSAWGK